MATNSPDATSSDYNAMCSYWAMVEDMLQGADAVKAGGETYLPKFPEESQDDYDYRLANAKFTNIYADIVQNLAAKPFSEEVSLSENTPERMVALAEDIDGRGNNLHVFAASTFFDGINFAVDWIFVDYTKARKRADGQPLSIAEERAQGLRPYWVHVPAKRLLAVYTDVIAGKEEFVHARIRENVTQRSGFDEVTIERVRVLNREPIYETLGDGSTSDRIVGYAPATYEIWERRATNARRSSQWMVVERGNVTIGVIPLVPFITGRRIGGAWRFVPPMQDAAHLQIEHYQQETALKSIKELTAFPMLAGNGVSPAVDGAGNPLRVPIGPRTVLYAPPYGEKGTHGEWTFIEPSAESLKFLAEDVANTEKQLREIGRQPLTAQTGNLTVVTTAFAAQKGNSAIQAWALNLKDALEQAWKLTAKWMNEAVEPEVRVFTDFAIGMTDDKGPDVLDKARDRGDISRRTFWDEMQRRGILSADFDAEAEEQALLDEIADPDGEDDLTGAATPDPEGDLEDEAA